MCRRIKNFTVGCISYLCYSRMVVVFVWYDILILALNLRFIYVEQNLRKCYVYDNWNNNLTFPKDVIIQNSDNIPYS